MPKTSAGYDYYPTRDKPEALVARAQLRGGPAPKSAPVLVNPAFGLPIPYPTWGGMTINLVGKDDKELRRPSPLAFRVWKQGSNKYRVLVLLMRSKFLPVGGKVVASAHGHSVPVATAISAWWKHLDDFFIACDGDELSFC